MDLPTRRLSLLTPSGHLTLGNLLGALRGMAADQGSGRCVYGVSDLHALTTTHDPRELAAGTRELQTLLLAAGIDPDRSTTRQMATAGRAQVRTVSSSVRGAVPVAWASCRTSRLASMSMSPPVSSIGRERILPMPRRRAASARAMPMTMRPARRRARARSRSSVAPVMSASIARVSSGRSARC